MNYEFQCQMLQVHDRAQVLTSCSSEHNGGRPTFVGTIERWSTQRLNLPNTNCVSSVSLFILVLSIEDSLLVNNDINEYFQFVLLFFYFLSLTGREYGSPKLWTVHV